MNSNKFYPSRVTLSINFDSKHMIISYSLNKFETIPNLYLRKVKDASKSSVILQTSKAWF